MIPIEIAVIFAKSAFMNSKPTSQKTTKYVHSLRYLELIETLAFSASNWPGHFTPRNNIVNVCKLHKNFMITLGYCVSAILFWTEVGTEEKIMSGYDITNGRLINTGMRSS